MKKIKMLGSIIKEYGIPWLLFRTVYSLKLKTLCLIPKTERVYEKKTVTPTQIDIFDIDIDPLESFIKEKLSEADKMTLLSVADKACHGILIGFSSLELDYGNPIDWQLNPLTGARCSKKEKWYKIPDFDKSRGDIKIVWEASRFSHFVTLARAFLLTGEKKYYEAFSSQLGDWVENNQYSYGANYKCGQECSLRMINAMLSYSVFHNKEITDETDTDNLKRLIECSYKKILSNFFYAHRCIKNNHTISELTGMIIGAWCSKDEKRLRKAYKMLDRTIQEQFTEDGGYIQFSFNYQRLALQDLECVLHISKKLGIELSEQNKKRIKNAVLLMYNCQDQSGDMPNYGANDGALVFPVSACGYRDFSPVINTTYALLEGKQLYNDGIHQEELIWFSRGQNLSDYEKTLVEKKHIECPEAGIFTFRESDFWSMVVCNEYHSRPGHFDQLHFDLWIKGINVLCDSGTYSYASEECQVLSGSEGHNTATVLGRPQMNSNGRFMVFDRTRRLISRCDGSGLEGTVISKNGYTHKRKIIQKSVGYDLTDEVDKDFFISFHTRCDVEINDNSAVLSYNGNKLVKLTSTGRIEVYKCKTSLFYLQYQECNCITIKASADIKIHTKIEIIKEK